MRRTADCFAAVTLSDLAGLRNPVIEGWLKAIAAILAMALAAFGFRWLFGRGSPTQP